MADDMTVREAAEELGVPTRAEQRRRVARLLDDADRRRADLELALDVRALVWGPWQAGHPSAPAGTYVCEGVLPSATPRGETDTLELSIVVGPHPVAVTCFWRSTGREPSPAAREQLLILALAHATTAPTGHHPGAGIEAHGDDHDRTANAVAGARTALHLPAAARDDAAVRRDPQEGARAGDDDRGDVSAGPRDGQRGDGRRGGRVLGQRRDRPPARGGASPADDGAAAGRTERGVVARRLITAAPSPAGVTPPATPTAAMGAHPARITPRAAAPSRPGGSSGPRWIDHVDHPCTLEEHHAHHALGSSGLRRYVSQGQPARKTADLGSAVGWLATNDERSWCALDAKVVSKAELKERLEQGETIAEWQAAHRDVIVLAPAEWKLAAAMASALQADPYLDTLLRSRHVQVERTVLATHARTGVRCKARPDLRVPGVWLGDIKTTSADDLLGFAHKIGDYGYDAQAALYEGIEASRYGLDHLRCGFDLIVVAREAPHRVMVVPIAGPWLARGRRLVELELDLRRLHEETRDRPPLWWEGRIAPEDVPPPTRIDTEKERRIREHVQLQRAHHRADAQRRATGSDPR